MPAPDLPLEAAFGQSCLRWPSPKQLKQIFSRVGLLSDPNIDQDYLATLVMISCNKKACQPTTAAIKAKYYELFRGKGRLSEEGEGEEMEGEESEEEGGEPADGGQAGSSAQHAGQWG